MIRARNDIQFEPRLRFESRGNHAPQVFTSELLTWWTESLCNYQLICTILLAFVLAMLTSAIIWAVWRTTWLPRFWSVCGTSLVFPWTIGFWVYADCLGGETVTNTDLVLSCVIWATALDYQRQHHFLISGVFTPPVLWDPINKLFESMELFVMYGDLYVTIRFDYACCWCNLKWTENKLIRYFMIIINGQVINLSSTLTSLDTQWSLWSQTLAFRSVKCRGSSTSNLEEIRNNTSSHLGKPKEPLKR